jgi:carboxypeptidase family protein/TonB-dependent receptor-like protein
MELHLLSTELPTRGLRSAAALIATLGAVLIYALVTALSLHAQTPASRSGGVEGVAYDSLRKRPLEGTMVQLIQQAPGAQAYNATTDARGHFHIDDVRPGSYVAGMLDPLLDTLGVLAPYAAVTVAEGASAHVSLAIPPAARLTAAICASAPGEHGAAAAADTTGLLVGHVYDATSGAPAVSSLVAVIWSVLVLNADGARRETRQVHAKTNDDGWFAICGLGAGDYQVRAEQGARATGFVDFALEAREIQRMTLAIGSDTSGIAGADSTIRNGSATVSGVVTAAGKPLEGAQVAIEGGAATAATDVRGMFTLLHVPDGTRMVEARALGFAPTRVRADPSRSEPRTVSIAMEKRVNTLDAVTVYGTRGRRMTDLNGFMQRSRGGFGKFLTRAQIDAADAISVCDLLRRVVGVRVQEGGLSGCQVSIRGATSGAASGAPRMCEPKVYLDGAPFGTTVAEFARTISPREIMGIEIYTSATAPPQYQGGCGSIVVWTRT